jgi:hypothetical protein
LILGVQKSNPALPWLLKARASVLTTVATFSISSSSKAADIRMGMANDVAYENATPALANDTPGEPATPWRASFHQEYAGKPILGAPGLWLISLLSGASQSTIWNRLYVLDEIAGFLLNIHGPN